MQEALEQVRTPPPDRDQRAAEQARHREHEIGDAAARAKDDERFRRSVGDAQHGPGHCARLQAGVRAAFEHGVRAATLALHQGQAEAALGEVSEGLA